MTLINLIWLCSFILTVKIVIVYCTLSVLCLFSAAAAQFPHRPHYGLVVYYPVSCLHTHSLVQPDVQQQQQPAWCCSTRGLLSSLCCPVVLSLSPPHLAAGLWAARLRWLIISCLSRDHLPSGPAAQRCIRGSLLNFLPAHRGVQPPG